MRLIDADKLIERIKGDLAEGTDGSYMFQRFVDEEPTVDPVRHRYWVQNPVTGRWSCSGCHCTTRMTGRYCSICGAKMDEAQNEE